MAIVARVWNPINNNPIQCRGGCWKNIVPGEVFICDDWHMSYIANENSWPSANIRCFSCGIAYALNEAMNSTSSAFNQGVKDSLAALCKIPVREELHKIIRDECADPNGPISPGTGTSSP